MSAKINKTFVTNKKKNSSFSRLSVKTSVYSSTVQKSQELAIGHRCNAAEYIGHRGGTYWALQFNPKKRERQQKTLSHIWMNSLHFGVNHLQRRPHNKIPTFFQVINSTKVKNKKGRRRSVHGTLTKKLLLTAGLSESPAWNIAALPRRERHPNMLNPPKGRQAGKQEDRLPSSGKWKLDLKTITTGVTITERCGDSM